MAKLRNTALLLSALTLAVLLALVVFAQPVDINTFKGNISISGSSAPNGVFVEAFIGSSSSPAKNYTVGALDLGTAGNYTFDFICGSGSTAFLKVWGINATTQTCSNQLINFTNLSVSLVANDGACSYANACSGGFCCSSTNAAVNQSAGSGACQSVACGTGITIPAFAINATSIINTQTVNFTINITSQIRHNVTAANFSLVTPSGGLDRNFTIPSNGRNFNISYQIFAASEASVPGTYNITAVQVTDNGSVTNRTTLTTLNFTVSSRATIPGFSLSAASITTAQTVNFTVNLSNTYYNVTAANFTLVTPSGNISRNFTIPSNGKNFNISYKIFNSAETATAGTYNVTAVQVTDNGSITNVTVITNMNFTVTAVAAAAVDTGGGGSTGGGGGGGGGGGSTTPAPAPSQETVDTVKDALPATFQVAADAGNVEYKTVAAPEVKAVAAKAEAAASDIKHAVDLVKTEEAQQELGSIRAAVSAGGATTVQAAGGSVKKTIEVVKATNKVTNEEVTVSVVKLSVTAPADKALKNVEVIEVIPKAAASNVNQVTFKGEKPIVLEADPVVKWFFSELKKGQNKDLSYAISKDIRNIGTSTVAVQGRAEAVPPAAPAVPPEAPASKAGEKQGEVKKPTPVNTLVLVAVLAVVAVGGWLFLKSRKKVMK